MDCSSFSSSSVKVRFLPEDDMAMPFFFSFYLWLVPICCRFVD